MKFSVAAAFLALSARAAAENSDFDKILGMIAALQEEADALALRYYEQDLELVNLRETCGQPIGSTPIPIPIPADVPSSTPMTTQPTFAEPTPASSDEAERVQPELGGKSWTPKVGDHYNYNLQLPVDIGAAVEVFFIDMDGQQQTIDDLHAINKAVVCYISIGTVESWRADSLEFPSGAVGGDVAGWAGENWLDVKDPTVREIMTARVKKAADMNCDAIEPDNMMAYQESSIGVEVSEADQIDYNTWFAGVVHEHGMKVGVKNSVDLAFVLEPYFDFALNEECFQWNECEVYQKSFIAAGKPVFNVEYRKTMDHCDLANSLGIDSIVKNLKLDSSMCSCSDPNRDINCGSII